VLNTCHKGSSEGRIRTAEGKAKIASGSGNAKLKVSFFGLFFFGVIGSSTCREATPAEPVKAAFLRRASEFGYDTSMLRMTQQ
jgi:apolipoprotein D and lipocalin family protein